MLALLKKIYRYVANPTFRRQKNEYRRIKRIPRFTPFTTSILGKQVHAIDSPSFLYMYREIFRNEIYRFTCESTSPLILDCGGNIGMSTIYFKTLYPAARIITFEPDQEVVKILKKNIKAHDLDKVRVIEKGVWKEKTELDFIISGSDGSSIVTDKPGISKSTIQTVRLRDYIQSEEKVDFLKIDIEGAETDVILDCQDILYRIDHIFVEYHSFVNHVQTLDIIVTILKNNGFRVHIHTGLTSAQPFYHRRTRLGQDLQLNIFAYKDSN